MRKLFMVMAVILISAVMLLGCKPTVKPALAEEVNLPNLLAKLPALNQSILFNLTDSELDYASSVTLVQLLNKSISLDIGWSPRQEILGLASVKLVEIKNYLNYPILRWITIEPFVAYGFDRIENFKEFGEGKLSVGVKLISIKY